MRCQYTIDQLAPDDAFLKRNGLTWQDVVDASGELCWVTVIAGVYVPSAPMRADVLPRLLSCHQALVTRAATHLQLTCLNVQLSGFWTAAGMLHPDPINAQHNGVNFEKTITSKADEALTPFE